MANARNQLDTAIKESPCDTQIRRVCLLWPNVDELMMNYVHWIGPDLKNSKGERLLHCCINGLCQGPDISVGDTIAVLDRVEANVRKGLGDLARLNVMDSTTKQRWNPATDAWAEWSCERSWEVTTDQGYSDQEINTAAVMCAGDWKIPEWKRNQTSDLYGCG